MNNILHLPLKTHEIRWIVTERDADRTALTPCPTTEAVRERLNAEFGARNWQIRYTPVSLGPRPGVIVSISVKNPETGEWTEKQGFATAVEEDLPSYELAMALAQAAALWGIGRELSQYPKVVLSGVHSAAPEWAKTALEEIPQRKERGEVLPPIIILSPADPAHLP